jgi:hypothetical protein
VSRYSLDTLHSRFDADINQVEADFRAARESADRRRVVATGERCVVFLQDSYSRFVRDLIIRSSLGNATTASGTRLPPGARGVLRQSDALAFLRKGWPPKKNTKPPWWEPNWYRAKEWGIALRLLKPANSATISAALGSSTSPAEQIRLVRNFAVHRGAGSALGISQVAMGVGVAGAWQQPCDILVFSTGGVVCQLEELCARLRAISAAAVR